MFLISYTEPDSQVFIARVLRDRSKSKSLYVNLVVSWDRPHFQWHGPSVDRLGTQLLPGLGVPSQLTKPKSLCISSRLLRAWKSFGKKLRLGQSLVLCSDGCQCLEAPGLLVGPDPGSSELEPIFCGLPFRQKGVSASTSFFVSFEGVKFGIRPVWWISLLMKNRLFLRFGSFFPRWRCRDRILVPTARKVVRPTGIEPTPRPTRFRRRPFRRLRNHNHNSSSSNVDEFRRPRRRTASPPSAMPKLSSRTSPWPSFKSWTSLFPTRDGSSRSYRRASWRSCSNTRSSWPSPASTNLANHVRGFTEKACSSPSPKSWPTKPFPAGDTTFRWFDISDRVVWWAFDQEHLMTDNTSSCVPKCCPQASNYDG